MGRTFRVLLKETAVLQPVYDDEQQKLVQVWEPDHHVWVVLNNCVSYETIDNGAILTARDADGRGFGWPMSNVLSFQHDGARVQDS